MLGFDAEATLTKDGAYVVIVRRAWAYGTNQSLIIAVIKNQI